MKLTVSQFKHLRRLGHPLKPVVFIGTAGVSPAVLAEIDGTLEHHELIKIRIRASDRAARDAMLEKVVTDSNATLVQRIGHIALIYRRAEKPKIDVPAARALARSRAAARPDLQGLRRNRPR